MDIRPSAHIDGQWRTSSDTIDITDAADESVIATISLAGRPDAQDAVRAARRAFDSWSQTSVGHRRDLLTALADGLAGRATEIAALASREVGSTITFAERVQAGLPMAVLRTTIDEMDMVDEEEQVANSRLGRLPVGVVVAITPWNYPLYQLMAKVAPALAAGCTVVIKPPQQAPLTSYILVEELVRAGFPAGVVNVVQGRGREVGEVLAGHPDVDLVSFTGSTGAGSRIAELASANVTRVALELGGKSACIITDDADLDVAIPAVVNGFLINTGQTCAAQTRLIVPRHRLAEIEERLVAEVGNRVVGDPSSPQTHVGPVISAGQRESILEYIAEGMRTSRLLVGGTQRPQGCERGHFVAPTIFSDTDPEARIAQEEIFGPVLVIHAVDDEDEAVAVANNSPYGLSGAVWAADPERGLAVARRIRTGQVAVNGGAFNPLAPFGGFKRSGYGRELGRHGLEEYLEIQSVQMP